MENLPYGNSENEEPLILEGPAIEAFIKAKSQYLEAYGANRGTLTEWLKISRELREAENGLPANAPSIMFEPGLQGKIDQLERDVEASEVFLSKHANRTATGNSAYGTANSISGYSLQERVWLKTWTTFRNWLMYRKISAPPYDWGRGFTSAYRGCQESPDSTENLQNPMGFGGIGIANNQAGGCAGITPLPAFKTAAPLPLGFGQSWTTKDRPGSNIPTCCPIVTQSTVEIKCPVCDGSFSLKQSRGTEWQGICHGWARVVFDADCCVFTIDFDYDDAPKARGGETVSDWLGKNKLWHPPIVRPRSVHKEAQSSPNPISQEDRSSWLASRERHYREYYSDHPDTQPPLEQLLEAFRKPLEND